MCTFDSVARVGLNTLGSYLTQRSTSKAYQSYIDAASKVAITEMNYAFQDYEDERVNAFDSAVAEIDRTRNNSLQLESGVRAAVAENMQGRTANLIVRDVEGDTARATSSIKENYKRKSNEIDKNKERTYLTTQARLRNLEASAPQMPSRFANFLGFAGESLGEYTRVRNKRNTLKSQGMQLDFWSGGPRKVR